MALRDSVVTALTEANSPISTALVVVLLVVSVLYLVTNVWRSHRDRDRAFARRHRIGSVTPKESWRPQPRGSFRFAGQQRQPPQRGRRTEPRT